MTSTCPYEIVARGPVRLDEIPDGPVLVRNAAAVRDLDGELHAVERPVVALCACGFTQRAPWCDSTHKVATKSV